MTYADTEYSYTAKQTRHYITTWCFSTDYTCKGEYRHLSTGKVMAVTDSRRVEVQGMSFQPQSVSVGIGGEAKFTCETVGEIKVGGSCARLFIWII